MKTFKRKSIQTVKSVICDRCSREALSDNPDADFDEFTSIAYRGGYHSIFGDGCAVNIDMCQHCLKETLGAWLKVGKNNYLPAE